MLDFAETIKNTYIDFIKYTSKRKYCDEIAVMALLIHFFPDKFYNLKHSDKPDLQIENLIRIEVTSGLHKSYNSSIGEFTNYRLGKNGKAEAKLKKKIEQNGGEYIDNCIFHKSLSVEDQLIPIRNCINNKLKKLSSYRDKYEECILTIILEVPLPGVISEAISYFANQQDNALIKFDSIILITNSYLYFYNYKTRIFNFQFVEKKEKKLCDVIGVLAANEKIKSVKECFVTPSKQIEIDCLKEVKDNLFNNKIFDIKTNGANVLDIYKYLNDAKTYNNDNSFPDFKFHGGLVEHFIVTSSKETRKGSSYKIHESNVKKEIDYALIEAEKQLFFNKHSSQCVTTNKYVDIYSENSYEYFLSSFKKHVSEHYKKLEKNDIGKQISIFLIDQQGGRLGIYKDNKFYKFYFVSEDKYILKYLKTNCPLLNYIIIKNSDSIEILDLLQIDCLIDNAIKYKDIRGGRSVKLTLNVYVDL